LDWLGGQLGFKSREDWYQIQQKDFIANHGATLLIKHFHSSPHALLSSVYSDFNYLPWLFSQVPAGFFDTIENQKRYVEWLVSIVGAKGTSELKAQHFLDHHGGGLLNKYGGSPHRLLESLAWSRERSSLPLSANDTVITRKKRHHWTSIENQRQFMVELAAKIGFEAGDFERWYHVPKKTVVNQGGLGLLKIYNQSMSALLAAVFPEHEWLPWKFAQHPKKAWEDETNMEKVIRFVGKELKIQEPEDWYRVSVAQLRELGVAAYFEQHGGVIEVVKKLLPDQELDEKFMESNIFKKTTKLERS